MTKYLMIDTSLKGYAGIISDCTERHALAFPNNLLSINQKHDGSAVFVKIAGADQAWLDSMLWKDSVISYDSNTEVLGLINSPEWYGSEE